MLLFVFPRGQRAAFYFFMSNIKGLFFKDIRTGHVPEILHETYAEGIYERFLGGKKDLTILELGGNVGIATFFFYDYAKKIYVLEPAQESADVIRQMVSFNQMEDKVELIQKAVSDKNGTATFYHSSYNTTVNSLNPSISIRNEPTEQVETITLDKLFTQYNIDHVDFMNLDIEGAEMEVVASEGFRKVADKIDSILVEYHSWTGRNPSQLTTPMMDAGFDVFQVPSNAVIFGAIKRK